MIRQRRLIFAIALIVLVVVGLSLAPASRETFRRGMLDLFKPVVRVADKTRTFFTEVDENIQTLEQAQKEAHRLTEENSRLGAENQVLRRLESENARLREMLGFKQQSSLRLLPCKMVARDPAAWWSTITIDRGWQDNSDLRPDLPIVSPRGIVGKTTTVGAHTTEVLLLVDANCKIASIIESSREQGIVVGEGGWQQVPRARMKFVTKNAVLEVGERVFTSGLGGVFPAGLAIGSIVEVPGPGAGTSFGLSREAVLDPAVDLKHLDELFIVVGVQ